MPGLHCIQVADHIKIASRRISMLNRTQMEMWRTEMVWSLSGTCCLSDAMLVPCTVIANPV